MTTTPPPGESAPPPGLSLGRFSEVVGAIYECALAPDQWAGVVAQVCEAIGGPAGWIGVHEPRQVRSVYQIEFGTDPQWQKRLRDEFVPISPFIVATHHFQAGEVFSVDDVVEYDEFLEGRFYREWAAPQGWPDNIFGILTKDADRFAWLGVNLATRATPVHKARTAAFLPHLSRALRISDLLEYRAAQAADLVAAVESLSTGLMLVDAGMRLRGVNSTAEGLIRDSGLMSAATGSLRARGESGARLSEAVEACAAGLVARGGVTILFPGRDGGLGLLAQVLPLARPRGASEGHAVAAIFLSRPSTPKAAPVEAVVSHYGLTPSETRVLLAMLAGQTPREIAAATGVAMPTVRTHLSRLYGKTGASGQTDLMRLISSIGSSA